MKQIENQLLATAAVSAVESIRANDPNDPRSATPEQIKAWEEVHHLIVATLMNHFGRRAVELQGRELIKMARGDRELKVIPLANGGTRYELVKRKG